MMGGNEQLRMLVNVNLSLLLDNLYSPFSLCVLSEFTHFILCV